MSSPNRCWIAILLLVLPAAAQTTWHVDDDGVAPGTGTQTDPYTSIHYAVQQPTTLAGDTVLVAPGTYQEQIIVSNAVTIRSEAGPLVTKIVSPSPNANGMLMLIPTSDNYGINGFTLKGPAHKLIYQNGGVVEDCIIDGRNATHTGFDMFDGSMVGCTVTGCQIGVRGDTTFSSALQVFGSVLWGNDQDIWDNTFIYKKVEFSAGLDGNGVWTGYGPGNVIGDPGLWSVEFHDFWLLPGSPCIDAGDPTAEYDPDGTPADIGALTYDPAHFYGPVVYCTAKPASGGCLPAISATGTSSFWSPVPFHVGATGIVENVLGILIHAPSLAQVPFQGGSLCIGGTILRTAPQFSGAGGAPCTGGFQFEFNAYVQSGVPSLNPGDIVFAQYWFRDPNDPLGFSSGLSDAVRFGIGL
jgi:hypothetical protein